MNDEVRVQTFMYTYLYIFLNTLGQGLSKKRDCFSVAFSFLEFKFNLVLNFDCLVIIALVIVVLVNCARGSCKQRFFLKSSLVSIRLRTLRPRLLFVRPTSSRLWFHDGPLPVA